MKEVVDFFVSFLSRRDYCNLNIIKANIAHPGGSPTRLYLRTRFFCIMWDSLKFWQNGSLALP